ncbi:MAG: carboxypeptidase regulatory-like domain-containing protein [SAR324 cluster bacterium]|nr:carboxypeptidase regulatory-like domain-containing protein [SAR324 cluster bacterium]
MRIFISLVFVCLLFGASQALSAKKYKVIEVKNGGSVSGSVLLKGKVPNPERIAVAKNPEACGTEDRMIKWVEAGEKGGLQNMVVYLYKVKKGKGWKNDSGTYEIDQKDCDFHPWLKIVPKGSKLIVKNSDPVLHNIHIRELKGVKPGKRYRPVKKTVYNEGQPPGSGDINTEIKTRMRGNLIRINCEAHNFMFAWMFAADHPYVVQTNADGSYSIDNIPAGKYKLRAWHPTLGLKEQKIKVAAGASVTQDFTFKGKK